MDTIPLKVQCPGSQEGKHAHRCPQRNLDEAWLCHDCGNELLYDIPTKTIVCCDYNCEVRSRPECVKFRCSEKKCTKFRSYNDLSAHLKDVDFEDNEEFQKLSEEEKEKARNPSKYQMLKLLDEMVEESGENEAEDED